MQFHFIETSTEKTLLRFGVVMFRLLQRADLHDCSFVMIRVCIFLVSWVPSLEIEYLVGLKRISLFVFSHFAVEPIAVVPSHNAVVGFR